MIRTRFPPEPNGFLHLGHVKAMLYNFQYHPECSCILRFDDTNPETEKTEFVASIKEDIHWMGFSPSAITSTSDYFDILYEFAEKLIHEGKAYIDFSTPKEIKEGRAACVATKWRDVGCEDNLLAFRRMREGHYLAGECVLRLKIDMAHENAVMRDPIAYRINYTPHHKTGKTWCIYPSYDYSHGIVDALECITYSYCTSEFMIRRDLYMWSVLASGLTPANVIEFGRLNVEGICLSKRKLIPLVDSGELSGYDDPRLFTIRGLRRRGFTPELLKTLAGLSGLDMRDTILSKDIVLHHLRTHLYEICPKAMAVIEPLTIKFVDGTSDSCYIDRIDFRTIDSSDYYRLAPGKTVRLRHSSFIEYQSHSADGNEVYVKTVIPDTPKRVKGILHWVPFSAASPAIFELYDDIDISSRKIITNGFIYRDMSLSEGMLLQFERIGFFRLDRFDRGIPVFLKIVGLRSASIGRG